MAVTVVGCGDDTDNKLPLAQDPNAGPTTGLPNTDVPTDSRIPEWVYRSAPIQLSTAGNYTNLEDLILAANEAIVPPVVGDPLIAMSIESGRSTQVKGQLYLAVEDKEGFAWREWSSLEQMSQRSSSFISSFFLDDEVVVKVTGPITSEKFMGTISFRSRQNGETQCIPYTVTYTDYTPYCVGQETTYNGQRACYGYWDYYPTTRTEQQLDTAACGAYMNSGNPNVKTLGTFEILLSKWLK